MDVMCPVCGEGTLTPQLEKSLEPLDVFDSNSPYGCIYMEFSVCSTCGSEVCVGDQMRRNIERMNNAREYYNANS